MNAAPTTAPPVGTLMVIEDDAVERMLYERVIGRSGTVSNMVSFGYAKDALTFLEQYDEDVDVILLDINMPRMNGFEFLDALMARYGAAFRAKVYVVSSSSNPRDAKRAKNYPAVRDFLDKPLTSAHVERIISEYLNA